MCVKPSMKETGDKADEVGAPLREKVSRTQQRAAATVEAGSCRIRSSDPTLRHV